MSKYECIGHYSFIDFGIDLNFPDNILNRMSIGTFDDIEDASMYATLMHETTHKLQNLASSYGIWKSKRLLLAANIVSYIINSELKDIKIQTPIDKFIPRADDSPQLSKKRINSYEKFGIPKMMFETLKVVDGPTAPTNKNWEAHFRNINPPKGYATPRTQDKTSRMVKTFGTNALIEGHARMHEIHFIWNARDISKDIAQKLHQKLSRFAPFNSYLGIVDHSLGGTLKVRSDKNLKSLSFIVALIMTDIALNPDIPDDFESDMYKVDWEDFNPAWRFCKLGEIVAKEKISEKSNIVAQDIYDMFLDRTGWISPYEAISRQLVFARELEGCLPMNLINKLLQYRKNNVSPFLDWLYGGEKSELAGIVIDKPLIPLYDLNRHAKEMIKLMFG